MNNDKYIIPSPVDIPQPLTEEDKEFMQFVFDDTIKYETPPFLFEYRAPGQEYPVGFSPIGGIQALSGQKKNGKSIMASVLLAAVLCNGKETGRMAERFPGFRVRQSTVAKLGHIPTALYIDTEQEKENTSVVVERAKWLAEWPAYTECPRLHALWLRQLPDGKGNPYRWKVSKWAINYFKPDLVILDGIRDVVKDFNNLEESSQIINEIASIASQNRISFWNTLHMNPRPADEDSKMRGHLGTELGNKVTDTFSVKKKKNPETQRFEFTVSQIDARGMDVPEFTIQLEGNPDELGFPKLKDADTSAIPETTDEKRQRDAQEVNDYFKDFNWQKSGATYTELERYIKSKFGISSNRKIKQIFDIAREEMIIIQPKVHGKYYYKGLQSDSNIPTEGTLPKGGDKAPY